LNNRNYTNPALATCAAICGIYSVLSLSYCIDKVPILKRVLTVTGSSSLFILIFHWPVGRAIYDYLEKVVTYERRLWPSVFAFVMSVVVPCLIQTIVSKSNFLSVCFLPTKAKSMVSFSQKACRNDNQSKEVS
jgi:polysaccharide biosynthesis protein PslL